MSLALLVLAGVPLTLFALMLVVQIVAYRIGRSRPRIEGASCGTVESGVFALLGLILAFQFGGAAGRLDRRRAIGVDEVNAIGTAYLRVDLLPASHQQYMRERFVAYVDSRIRAQEAGGDMTVIRREIAVAQAEQARIWSHAVTGCALDPRPTACMILLPSLNVMFDAMTTRWVTARIHAPIVVVIFMIAVALLAAIVAGLAMSHGTLSPFYMLLFAALVSATMYVILDLEFPRIGFINIGSADDALHELRAGLP